MANLVGARIERKEDKKFLTGKGRYTADINLPNQTYAYFVRSPHARAKIVKLDLSKAKKAPGVIDIFTGGKLSQVNRVTGMNTVGLLSQIGILNPFNRQQESEADYLGLIFSSLSGYDIRETVNIWERMKKANKGKETPEFMSTHPSPTNRIKKINEWMNSVILDYPPIKVSR